MEIQESQVWDLAVISAGFIQNWEIELLHLFTEPLGLFNGQSPLQLALSGLRQNYFFNILSMHHDAFVSQCIMHLNVNTSIFQGKRGNMKTDQIYDIHARFVRIQCCLPFCFVSTRPFYCLFFILFGCMQPIMLVLKSNSNWNPISDRIRFHTHTLKSAGLFC